MSSSSSVVNPSGQETLTQSRPVVRKKFAVPPVKVACLDCRASRTRCDGKQDCFNCVTKGKTCVYAQSRRGGSRIRKRKIENAGSNGADSLAIKSEPNTVQLPVVPEMTNFDFLSAPMGMVAPGAGLKELDMSFNDTEFIFDTIFGNSFETKDSGYESSELGTSAEPEEVAGAIRVYMSDDDILNAYYVYIHPYFPILPPPSSQQQVIDKPTLGSRPSSTSIFTTPLTPFEPSTPLSLAISATLALIPHPSDPVPNSIESTLLRREQAQAFASATLQAIECESELPESSISPSEALSANPVSIVRKRFHPNGPLENESILALLMLTTYEYAQRGNITKVRNRAGQALVRAMDLGLHSRGREAGPDAEANRRAWWMTYVCVCQGAIFSSTHSPILLYDPRFTTVGPTFAGDKKAWPDFLQAQQMILTATHFVIDLDTTIKTKADTSAIWDRMLELDNIIEPLVTKADSWTLASSPPAILDWSELTVAHALRGIARIKINSARIKVHRYCAFNDMPVFAKRHCDLAAVAETPNEGRIQSPSCSCSTTYHSTIQSLIDNTSESSGYASTLSPPLIGCELLPFSSHFSSKVCLRAAFNIARSFQLLPYPSSKSAAFSAPAAVCGTFDLHNPTIETLNTLTRPPRMVPMFACCAMQGSYAMVMLSQKSREIGSVEQGETGFGDMNESKQSSMRQFMSKLEEGLGMILGALRNYSIAYEALGGMRDQIEIAAINVRGGN